jgi:serine/threonine-protein kinase
MGWTPPLLVAGRYAVQREVGRGGTAIVYFAVDHGANEGEVALKALKEDFATALGVERFRREIALASKLDHPRILRVLDAGEWCDTLYYVMPFVDGMTLRQRLARERQLSITEVLAIARDVGEGLAYAHARGILHRDVKPENILLDAGGSMLCDFGIGRALDRGTAERLTSSGIVLGTPAYMSPEQAAGETATDGRSDQYSLACVLYEALAGVPPYVGATAQSVLSQRVLHAPHRLREMRDSVPAWLSDAVMKALAVSPADRFASMDELLEALALSAPVTTRSGSAVPDGERRTARRWRRAGVVSGAVVLAAGTWMSLGNGFTWHRSAVPPGPSIDHSGPTMVRLVQTDGGARSDSATARAVTAAVTDLWKTVPGLRLLEPPAVVASMDAALRDGTKPNAPSYVVEIATARTDSTTKINLVLWATRRTSPARAIANASDSAARAVETRPAAERAALDLLRSLARTEPSSFRSLRRVLDASRSPDAIKLMVRGQQLFALGDVDRAREAYLAALRADSTCALAAFRSAFVLAWGFHYEEADSLLDAFSARRIPAATPGRLLARAQRFYVKRMADSAIRAFRQTVADDPTNIDGWLGLGESVFHLGWLADVPPTDAEQPLRRVFELDSAFAPINYHLVDLALERRVEPDARRFTGLIAPDDDTRPPRELLLSLMFGDARRRAVAFAELDTATRYAVTDVVWFYARLGRDVALADTVARALMASRRTSEDRERGAQFRLAFAPSLGRVAEAGSELLAIKPARASIDEWLAAAALAGAVDSTRVAPILAHARQIAASRIENPAGLSPDDDAHKSLSLLSQWALLFGTASDVAGLLRTVAPLARAARADPSPLVWQATLQARRSLLSGDTTAALGWLRRAVVRAPEPYSAFYPLVSNGPQRLVLMRLLEARGDSAGRAAVERSFANSPAISDLLFLPVAPKRR